MPNRKVFYSTLNKTENLIRANLFGKRNRRKQIESEQSIENLIAIRFEFIKNILKNLKICLFRFLKGNNGIDTYRKETIEANLYHYIG